MALFVEHVLLGIESQIPELCELVTEYVFLLNKVSSGSAGALSGDAGAPGLACRHPRGERPSRSLPILPGSAAGRTSSAAAVKPVCLPSPWPRA